MLGELISGHVVDFVEASGSNSAILSTLVRAVGRWDASLTDELDALVQVESERLKASRRSTAACASAKAESRIS
jgi:predicted methyltransferase